ncbi:MAG: adenylate/guanylate cyclase domain-containing protein [Spirochaetia bacterium]|nr:adenylate/guanylate cyclase domain-containing protein [Spirochaetia bacterium]
MSFSAVEILNQLNSGVCILDRNQNIVYINYKASHIFGVSHADLRGKSYSNMVFPHIPENMRDIRKLPVTIAMQSGKELNYTLYINRGFGSKIPVDCVVSPILDKNNTIIGTSETYITGDVINKRIQKTQMQGVMSQFLSLGALEYIEGKAAKREDSIAIKRYRTIAFLDIVGFTSMSEKYEPLTVINILNDFYQKVHHTIKIFEGDIDKFIGDAMLIVFSNTENAVRCMTDIILKDLPIVNAQLKKKYSEELSLHVGINSGWVIIGELGASTRKDFTVIGDNVNIASRIQSLTSPNEVWISAGCMSNIGQLGMLFEQVDTMKVKGKKRPLTLYKFQPEKLSMSKRVLVFEKSEEVKSDLKLRLRRMGVKEITVVADEIQLEREAQVEFDNMVIGPTAQMSEISKVQQILEKVGHRKDLIIPIAKDVKPESIIALERLGIHTIVAYDETENFDISLKNAIKSQSIKKIKAKEPMSDKEREKWIEEEKEDALNISGFSLGLEKGKINIEIGGNLEDDQISSMLIQLEKLWIYEHKKDINDKINFNFLGQGKFMSRPELEKILRPIYASEQLKIKRWKENPFQIKCDNEELKNRFFNIIKDLNNELVRYEREKSIIDQASEAIEI